MNVEDYIVKMKELHKSILSFLNNESNYEENFQNLINIINDQKITENSQELKLFLHLITSISNNCNRIPNFLNKIEQILKYFKNNIKQSFSNYKIFNIFKRNKRILLFLFEEKIIFSEQSIIKILTSQKYQKMNYNTYFSVEIESFLNEKDKNEIENKSNDFQQKRKTGENDNYICQLIRNDLIDEFISYVNKKSIFLSTTVDQSIFETNLFLIKRNPTLIEYASFFGSVQIFRYLYLNGVSLTPSLWIYAIHGNNPELISHLEELHLLPQDLSYKKCLIESIKCHHVEITDYILDNYIENYSLNDIDAISNIIKYYNFAFLTSKLENDDCFYFLCKYDYYTIVKILLSSKKININAMIILKKFLNEVEIVVI